MKTTTIALLLLLQALLPYTTAHTYLSSVNGLSQFDGIRPQRPTYERNSPIVDISSADMTCGWLPYASQPANRKLPLSAGDTVTLQFFHDGPYADDMIIDSSHRGPCLVYLASQTSGSPKWFKIWEQGLDSAGKFCVDYLRSDSGVNGAGKGKLRVQLPTYIPSGNYLLRTEIIALHEGYAIGKAQFYVNCVELSITNSGVGTLSLAAIPTVSMPGTYTTTDPGIFYNLYGGYLPPYTIPGPAVYKASSSTPATPATVSPTPAPATPSPVTPAPVTPAPVTQAPPTQAATKPPQTAPTTTPTTTTGQYINIQIHASATVWWLALRVVGPSQDTTSVELKDNGNFKSWTAFSTTNWGYFVFGQGEVTVPASLRLTSSSGAVVVLDYILGSVTPGAVINTAATYGGSAPAVTTPPVTNPPVTNPPVTNPPVTNPPVTNPPVTNPPVTNPPATTAPTTKPNAPPTAGPADGVTTTKVQVHAGSSAWWFAAAIVDHPGKTVASVQVQDSTVGAAFVNLSPSDWGYWVYQSNGKPLVAPLTVRVTSTVGTSITVSNVPITPSVTAASTTL